MLVRKARRTDLEAINQLQNLYGKMQVEAKLINHRDLSLVAIDEKTGAIIGFCWGGLMAGNSLIYIDKVVADPKWAKKGVINALYRDLLKLGTKIGVKTAIGLIRQDEFHERSAVNALKLAFAADAVPYTYVFGDIAHMNAELAQMEVA